MLQKEPESSKVVDESDAKCNDILNGAIKEKELYVPLISK